MKMKKSDTGLALTGDLLVRGRGSTPWGRDLRGIRGNVNRERNEM